MKFWVSSVWPPGLNAFESIVIYDRNAQLFQSFLGQLKKYYTKLFFLFHLNSLFMSNFFTLH